MEIKQKTVTRINPKTLAAPVGNYSHVTKISGNADIYTFSGQIGTDSNGNIPEDFNQQVSNTFQNIKHVLESQGLQSDDVIKVNIWSIPKIDWDHFYVLWNEFFGTAYPAMTVGYLSALGLPEIQIEIEIWAAK
ncbi:RidA family protein [Pedobacter caeni]|uniref:Enamine deaminase RidA, house cleaning of reactive enamine intermediates, YjgF/YER057c/UK114 family n=1 Tax=Pedobacter caeni TaxID=288992 RepID=A0A1M5A3F3_9SPHI|nr:RidA family protein [Pedobacter caeni]SHF24735.1 Enamine deaminase RidA, house cleaning of reactive enamine intermediates, YjgF/YER057c/UK114 family [Pedobacter caeni]